MTASSLLATRQWPTLEIISNAADALIRSTAAAGEAAAIAAAKRGSRAAVESIVRRHYDQCYALCRRLTCDEDQALDAAQEAMISVAREFGAFDERGELATWIHRVTTDAIFEATSRRSGTAARRSRTAGLFGSDASPSLAASLPVDELAEREPGLDLDGALCQMAEEERTALVLRDMLDLEYSAIGQVMLHPVGAVARLVAGGRLWLLEALEPAKDASPVPRPALDDAAMPQSPASGLGAIDRKHPALVELSVLLDNSLPPERALALGSHVESCQDCERHLDRFRAARSAVSAPGLPLAPRGARDRAVVAAAFVTSLSSVAKAARDVAGPYEGRPPREPFSTTGSPGTVRAVAVASRTRDSEPSNDPAGMEHRSPPGRARRATTRTRRVRAFLVLGAVMLTGLGGALVVALAQGRPAKPSAVAIGRPGGRRALPSPASSPTTEVGAVAQQSSGPALGALVLQLRPERGAADCTKARRRLESINGVFAVINPPPAKAAVVGAPPLAGTAAGCIKLGPSFASLWSGDIEHIAVDPLPRTRAPRGVGSTVALVLEATTSAVTRPSGLEHAERTRRVIDVVAEGTDVGTADIGRGSRITLHVTRAVAAFVLHRLSPALPSAKG